MGVKGIDVLDHPSKLMTSFKTTLAGLVWRHFNYHVNYVCSITVFIFNCHKMYRCVFINLALTVGILWHEILQSVVKCFPLNRFTKLQSENTFVDSFKITRQHRAQTFVLLQSRLQTKSLHIKSTIHQHKNVNMRELLRRLKPSSGRR